MTKRYLTVAPITRGKQLIDLLDSADTVDLDYERIDADEAGSALSALSDFCSSRQKAHSITDRIAQDKEAGALIQRCEAAGAPLSGGSFSRTCYDVDDSGGESPVCFGEWQDTCLVLRVGHSGEAITQANVHRLLEGYVSASDPNLTDAAEEEPADMLFNVMVTAMDDAWEQGVYEWDKARILEYTDKLIGARLKSLDAENLAEMASLPTLFMYEQNTRGEARVGTIKRIQDRSGKELRVIFELEDSIPSIPMERLIELKWELSIADYEFSRTHWAVKEGDLYQILRDAGIITALKEIAPPAVAEAGRDSAVEVKPTKVFLVHGRDDGKKNEVARFLERRAGLDVTILSERPNKGRSILTKFEQEANGASYAIVLMTADDLGHLRPELEGTGAAPNPKPRPRQNVVFELGFFIGKLGVERVCALVPSGVEKPSDYDGIVYIPLDTDEGWQRKLVTELHSADVPVSQTWWQAN